MIVSFSKQSIFCLVHGRTYKFKCWIKLSKLQDSGGWDGLYGQHFPIYFDTYRIKERGNVGRWIIFIKCWVFKVVENKKTNQFCIHFNVHNKTITLRILVQTDTIYYIYVNFVDFRGLDCVTLERGFFLVTEKLWLGNSPFLFQSSWLQLLWRKFKSGFRLWLFLLDTASMTRTAPW